MRITIICGNLAPGKDGVGDYSRAFANELKVQGHELQLVALRDSETISQVESGISIERFNNGLQSSKLQAVIDSWAPDVVSLQYVGFAYHSKGLIHQLIPPVEAIRKDRRLHVMVHEPWIRNSPTTTKRQQFLGQIQRHQLVKAIRRWKPEHIHTSNLLYQHVLRKAGIESRLLPLFGNIRYTPLNPETIERLFETHSNTTDSPIVLLPFSQSRHWSVDHCMDALKRVATAADTNLTILQIGQNVNLEQHWPAIESHAKANGWQAIRLGSQPEAIVSQCIQASTLGISGEHLQLAGKSGAVTTMREHGLPVLCSGTNIEEGPAEQTEQAGLYSLDSDFKTIVNCLIEPRPKQFESGLKKTAKQWIDDINQYA